MKYIFLYFSLILSSFISYCQIADTSIKVPQLPLIDNRIAYTGTITIDSSVSKDQLFENAEKWYSHNFETADNTLTIDNSADGEISGTGIIHVDKKAKHKEHDIVAGDIFFTIDLISKKGGYEYKVHSIYSIDQAEKFYYSDMYNEELYPLSKPKWSKTYREYMLTDMNSRVEQMIAGMQNDLKKR